MSDIGPRLRGEERERIPELRAMAAKHGKRKPYTPSTASEDQVRERVDRWLREEGIIPPVSAP